MSEKPKGGFKLKEFTVINFSINRTPLVQSDELVIEYKPSAVIDRKSKTFTLFLGVILKDSEETFNLNIESIGFFIFDDSVDLENLDSIFFLNAPAIIFPYIRAYVASVTALSGLDTVHIPVQNLSFLGNELKENTVFQEDDSEEV